MLLSRFVVSDSVRPQDSSAPGSPIPGILQARTLEWVAISFSSAWKWKVKGKSLSLSDSLWPHGLYRPWNSLGQNTGVGSLSFLQGLFPTQGSGIEPRSPTLLVDSLHAEQQGKPKNTGVGSLSLLQRIFLTQESNQGLLHSRKILYQLSYQGGPCTYHNHTVFFFFFQLQFYFIFKLYKIVLVLPNTKMNPPQVCMCSPSRTLLTPPSPYHPSGSSQCTSPNHPVSCIEPGLASRFIHDILHISMPFSQIFLPSPAQRP